MVHWSSAIGLSSGHNRLSRLSTEGLKTVLISWLLCTVLRVLCLLVLILITSVTYGISKSLCKVWLETYRGALLIILSIFDWNVWRILLLDGLCIPIALSGMSRWVAVLCYIRPVCCLGIAVNMCLLASSCHCIYL